MYNKIIIAGNLGRDPEMRYLPSGQAVTNFSVATNNSWTDKNTGETVKETTWFRVTVWGKQAEIMNEYLSQGSKVLVEGSLKCDPSTGGPRVFLRKDGTAGASFEITANVIRFLSSKNEIQQGGGAAAEIEDDIPF